MKQVKNRILLVVVCSLLLISHFIFAKFSDYPDRVWLVGGHFDSVVQPDGSLLEANNLALWNGSGFENYDHGTEGGAVRAAYFDDCHNMYVAGDFVSAGGVSTGPVAVWSDDAVDWSPVGNYTYSAGSSVLGISVDCYKRPSLGNRNCLCDVWVTGNFTFTFKNVEGNTVTATNIARYDAKGQVWDNLGGSTTTNITESKVGRVIYKRTISVLSISSHIMHVAGDGFYYQYHTDSDLWVPIINDEKAVFKAMNYEPEAYSPEIFVFGGMFQIPAEQGKVCINTCQYNKKTKKWHKLARDNELLGEVHSISRDGNFVYLAGGFQEYSINRIAVLKGNARNWTAITSEDSTQVTRDINTMIVCTRGTHSCTYGSTTIGGDDGFLKFFDARDQQWTLFGTTDRPFQFVNNTNRAQVHVVVSFIQKSSASSLFNLGKLHLIATLLLVVFYF